MIDLPLSATIANSSFIAVVGMSSTGASLTLAQPYALVISAQLTALTGPSHSFEYQTPEDDNVRCHTIIPTIYICLLICPPSYPLQKLTAGVITYICALSVGIVLLLTLICYFKSMTTKSILLDPMSFLSFSGSNDREMDRQKSSRWGEPGDYI